MGLDIFKDNITRIEVQDNVLHASVADERYTMWYDLAEVPEPKIEAWQWPEKPESFSKPADYLIISANEFAGALDPLIELNKQRGLTTRIVKIDDLYTWFNHGEFSPEVIR